MSDKLIGFPTDTSRRITSAVASTFCSQLLGDPKDEGPQWESEVLRRLEQLQAWGNCALDVKVPEGFEFYALYPEQYARAALVWSAEHTRESVLVVGIRSIGTTLSAVVEAVLARKGWQVLRMTVRPHGHPFDRQVDIVLPSPLPRLGIVVDEGPGLSGSSFKCVAEALIRAGVSDVSLFTGHGNPPARAESADWWKTPGRYFTPLEKVTWNERSLADHLMNRSAAFANGGDHGLADMSAGRWRSAAYASPEQWPAVTIPFERSKYRCGPILWKFSGLGSFVVGRKTMGEWRLAESAVGAAEIVDSWNGFTATRWIQGRRANITDGRAPELIETLAEYVASGKQERLNAAEYEDAIARLARIVEMKDTAILRGPRAGFAATGACLAPWDWVQSAQSAWVLTDFFGHDCNHTAPGQQPLEWDIAGTVVEWQFDDEQCAHFLGSLHDKGITVAPETLDFFCSAYAAFRLGQFELGLEMHVECPEERKRLERACQRYRESINRPTLRLPGGACSYTH